MISHVDKYVHSFCGVLEIERSEAVLCGALGEI